MAKKETNEDLWKKLDKMPFKAMHEDPDEEEEEEEEDNGPYCRK